MARQQISPQKLGDRLLIGPARLQNHHHRRRAPGSQLPYLAHSLFGRRVLPQTVRTLVISGRESHTLCPSSISSHTTTQGRIIFLAGMPLCCLSSPRTSPPTASARTPLQNLLETTESLLLMCTEHTADCPVCGKVYLVYVEFCRSFHPPLLVCPNGTAVNEIEMAEGFCPSPVCPNSHTGGCIVS